MADILARWIFFMLDIMWVVLVLVPLWLLYAIAAILYELTAWSIFYRIAKVTEKLQFKAYTTIRYSNDVANRRRPSRNRAKDVR